ncbi:MAG: methanol oxidation system protein MoxJ [Methylophilaceae bacterium]|uniref:methanol oxidation system protein MoxJ n=1 Tax=Methylovorus sp. MM2 TaxID=1848038 RepID=UPI0007E07309|nr:methanol oxidation system protein MoxJ [Methylovorus sp. MM2]OAM51345.1 methanol oxidation system protein MoxJ [Methylovorus sp. MM2]
MKPIQLSLAKLGLLLATSIFVMSSNAIAAEDAKDGKEPLRICAGEDELPYSNTNLEGFENRIAKVLADELGRKVEYVWWKDARYVVRDFLDKDKCDVVIGADINDPRMATTSPYYKSGYVFIYKKDKGDLGLTDWNSEYLKNPKTQIGWIPETPPEVMLVQIERFVDMFQYKAEISNYKSPRNHYIKYDPSRVVNDVLNGRVDVAVLWAPAAARYVKQSSVPLVEKLVVDNAKKSNGEKVPHQFSVSIGVRKSDTELESQLERALVKRKNDVDAILRAEGIPLLPIEKAKSVSESFVNGSKG